VNTILRKILILLLTLFEKLMDCEFRNELFGRNRKVVYRIFIDIFIYDIIHESHTRRMLIHPRILYVIATSQVLRIILYGEKCLQ
jgi:hypothetical protein